MGALSKLDAVNRMLIAAGEYPVSSLTDGVNDVSIALSILEELSIEEQAQGMNCSTYQQKFIPDSSGYINLPDKTLFVDSVDEDRNYNVVAHGKNPTRLYNIKDRTFVFHRPIRLRITVALDFESLPTPQQIRIVSLAAQRYQMLVVGDQAVNQTLAAQAQLNRALGRASDIRSKGLNLSRGKSATIRKALRKHRW